MEDLNALTLSQLMFFCKGVLMSQRSLSSSTSTSHRAIFRLALTLSIVGASTAVAQSGLPTLPPLPPTISNSDLPSIEYPFETKLESDARLKSKLMNVLGLGNVQRTANAPQLPAIELPPALHDPTEPSRIVTAAATETEQSAESAPAIALYTQIGTCGDTVGTCPSSSKDQPESCTNGTEQSTDEEQTTPSPGSVSLIDIDFSAKTKPVEPVAQLVRPVELAEPERVEVAEPAELAESAPARQPRPLTADASKSMNTTPKKLDASADRQPQLVAPSRSMSLKIEAPQLKNAVAEAPVSTRRDPTDETVSPVTVASTEIRFSDDQPAESTFSLSDFDYESEASASGPVSLHLSSATPKRLEVTAPRSMQVRVEGEDGIALARPAPTRVAPAPVPATQAPAAPVTSSSVISSTPVTSAERVNSAPVTPAAPMQTEPAVAPVAPRPKVHANLTSLAQLDVKADEPSTEVIPDAMNVGPAVSVKPQDATTIMLGSEIVELSVEHPSICQLIQTGSTTFSLVGLRAGETRIALITLLPTGERTVEIRSVTVAGNATDTRTGIKGLAEEMTRTISRIYPNSDVDVFAVNGELLVQGVVSSESDARKYSASFARHH
ncbi:MAG: hypothetical protein R3C53_09630 [Pirellulaceae bacterium]